MQKTFTFIGIFIILIVFSTSAKCDHITVNNIRMRVISSEPLRSHPRILTIQNLLKEYGTNCTEDNCMFEAEWKIIKHKLMLTRISNCDCNEKKQTANLKNLYIGKLENCMLPADWFTGKIWLSNQQPFTWFCMVCPVWRRETCVTVVKGIVTNVKEVVYPYAPDPNRTKTIDSLSKIVYQNIRWDKLKNLPEANDSRQVGVRFTTDSLGKSLAITIAPLKNEEKPDTTWVAEAKKSIVAHKWPVYFVHGQPQRQMWSLNLKFDKAQQKAFDKD